MESKTEEQYSDEHSETESQSETVSIDEDLKESNLTIGIKPDLKDESRHLLLKLLELCMGSNLLNITIRDYNQDTKQKLKEIMRSLKSDPAITTDQEINMNRPSRTELAEMNRTEEYFFEFKKTSFLVIFHSIFGNEVNNFRLLHQIEIQLQDKPSGYLIKAVSKDQIENAINFLKNMENSISIEKITKEVDPNFLQAYSNILRKRVIKNEIRSSKLSEKIDFKIFTSDNYYNNYKSLIKSNLNSKKQFDKKNLRIILQRPISSNISLNQLMSKIIENVDEKLETAIEILKFDLEESLDQIQEDRIERLKRNYVFTQKLEKILDPNRNITKTHMEFTLYDIRIKGQKPVNSRRFRGRDKKFQDRAYDFEDFKSILNSILLPTFKVQIKEDRQKYLFLLKQKCEPVAKEHNIEIIDKTDYLKIVGERAKAKELYDSIIASLKLIKDPWDYEPRIDNPAYKIIKKVLWDPDCKVLDFYFESLLEKFPNANFQKINSETNQKNPINQSLKQEKHKIKDEKNSQRAVIRIYYVQDEDKQNSIKLMSFWFKSLTIKEIQPKISLTRFFEISQLDEQILAKKSFSYIQEINDKKIGAVYRIIGPESEIDKIITNISEIEKNNQTATKEILIENELVFASFQKHQMDFKFISVDTNEWKTNRTIKISGEETQVNLSYLSIRKFIEDRTKEINEEKISGLPNSLIKFFHSTNFFRNLRQEYNVLIKLDLSENQKIKTLLTLKDSKSKKEIILIEGSLANVKVDAVVLETHLDFTKPPNNLEKEIRHKAGEEYLKEVKSHGSLTTTRREFLIST